MSRPIIVLKFGGSVLRSEAEVRVAVHEVYRWARKGWKVVAVVSALKGQTDALIERATHFGAAPLERARALLVGTGELVSASLLGMALDRAGLATAVAPPWAIGLRARGPALDAEPVSLDTDAFGALLARHDAVVAPGFIAIGEDGGLVLLGRGGSDISALFIASELRAKRCRLVKDVDGLYEWNPGDATIATARGSPRRYDRVSWAEARALGGRIIQEKAIKLAERKGLTFEVGTILADRVTVVSHTAAAFSEPASDAPSARLKVALLGCGVVGLGVHDALKGLADKFDLVSVTVRNPARAASSGVDPALLRTDAVASASEPGVDLVVEALGGLDPAGAAIDAALSRGATVITANKAAVAARGAEPAWAEAIRTGRLRFSAAVGGAAPMLEAVTRIAAGPQRRPIQRLDAVVNGTCNYVLGRLATGLSFDDAVRKAQDAGFAEADPSRDLDGRDAADKLCLLVRAAWGVTISADSVQRTPLSRETLGALQADAGPNEVVKQVSSVWVGSRGVEARVAPALVPRRSALAKARDEWNVLEIGLAEGRTRIVRGRGAGRVPTAESVLADILDARRALRRKAHVRAGQADVTREAAPLPAPPRAPARTVLDPCAPPVRRSTRSQRHGHV